MMRRFAPTLVWLIFVDVLPDGDFFIGPFYSPYRAMPSEAAPEVLRERGPACARITTQPAQVSLWLKSATDQNEGRS
ncbi:MAG TPA: hypothetical protein VF808_07955 [Ktedonobacterales bacterium]